MLNWAWLEVGTIGKIMLNWVQSQNVLGIKVQFKIGNYKVHVELGIVPGYT